ncbi:hypothetical protein BBP40_003669 [Aspergillus hancockii]|nr:hypothetical protein BBP40_003669 [Aspergillus hancockii]
MHRENALCGYPSLPQRIQHQALASILLYPYRLQYRGLMYDFHHVLELVAGVNTFSTDLGAPDLLPSFAALTSDDEREKKAQSSIPGTYTVIVIPETFSQASKQVDEIYEEPCRVSTSSSLLNSGQSSQMDTISDVNNPNVVILKTFPDSRRYLSSDRRSSTQALESDPRDSSSPTASLPLVVSNALNSDNTQVSPELPDHEATLLDHFRSVVWAKLIPGAIWVDDLSGHRLSAEIFEQEATTFPPLFRVIMAISALSLSREGGNLSLDAGSHYQQDFSFLQNIIYHSEDLLSDGLFLTQFLMLVYEITAAQSYGPNLWSHHISRLLDITFLRQSAFGMERYPFIIWWVCTIDLYALFSGAGAGEYVKTVTESNMLPGPESLLCFPSLNGFGVIDRREHDGLAIMHLYKDTFMLAVRLGLVAAEVKKISASDSYSSVDLQQQASDLREEFKRLWNSPDVHFWVDNHATLPKQLQSSLQQVFLLFHTSLLFYHTSMWPKQSIGLEESLEETAHHHATMILQHAEDMVLKNPDSPQHFIIFPLFLAGATARSSALKVKAWELLSNLEESEVGYNASTTCYMLQVVYERQMQQSSNGGGSFLWVDWVELLAERGFRLVSY